MTTVTTGRNSKSHVALAKREGVLIGDGVEDAAPSIAACWKLSWFKCIVFVCLSLCLDIIFWCLFVCFNDLLAGLWTCLFNCLAEWMFVCSMITCV